MKLAICFQVVDGLTWSLWAELTAAVEHLGFSGVSLSDHFPDGGDALETITALTYLASHSRTISIGTLVSPLSFRDPVMLARQAMMINSLSGWRMVLGIGAGWVEDEHNRFGYSLGDVKTREARFEEGVQVITQLVRCDAPVTFEGHYYQLRNASLQTPPQRPMPILIGGKGPKRTLPLVAKYADVWNCDFASVAVYTERSALLDKLILQCGRKQGDVKRTLFLLVFCWRDQQEMEQIASRLQFMSPGKSAGELFEWLNTTFFAVTGTPERVIEQLRAYEAAGVEELHVAMIGPQKAEHLSSLAMHILPHFMA